MVWKFCGTPGLSSEFAEIDSAVGGHSRSAAQARTSQRQNDHRTLLYYFERSTGCSSLMEPAERQGKKRSWINPRRHSQMLSNSKIAVLMRRTGIEEQDPGRATRDLVNALFVFHLRWERLPDELHFARLP